MRIFGYEFRRPRFGTRSAPGILPGAGAAIPIARGRRSFDAGHIGRLTASWSTQDSTLNQSLLRDLKTMRARSRDFFRNNELGRKFGAMLMTNIVGPTGFALKVDCRNPDGSSDVGDSRRVANAYARWTVPGAFDVTGRLSETLFDQLLVRMVARDGEALIRKVEGPQRGPHRCQLQLLPGHLLDELHNRDLSGGGRIRMGVEYDAWMRPVAYHLRIDDGGNGDMYGNASQRYQRVSADEIIHVMLVEDVDQWRGVPWAHAALRRARDLDKFEEAALIAANVGAGKMGFFQQKDPEAGVPPGGDEDTSEAGAAVQEFTSEVVPGAFDVIPDGYELQEYNPAYPSDTFQPFTTAVARMVATGLLVSYHGLTGDLTQVNFSSIRSGTLDEREIWKVLQNAFIQTVKRPLFSWWLGRAMLVDPELVRLPYAKIAKYDAATFTGRRWDWVDPRSDAAATSAEIEMGLNSPQQVMRDKGRDPDVIWREIEESRARGFGPAPASAPALTPDPAQDDDDAASAATPAKAKPPRAGK